MDINTIETIVRRPTRDSLALWQPGDAWLAGGSWLFSEPQPRVRRLFDLQGFGWPPLAVSDDGLEIAATCSIATLEAWSAAPADWSAARLIGPCCHALLGSFKVWNVATVGGNLCLALPAGPMTALTAALDGACLIWGPQGRDRIVPAIDFVTGERENVLGAGEILRSITLPAAALRRQATMRQISLSPMGRSGALLVGTREAEGGLVLTVTAATKRPFRIAFPGTPSDDDLMAAIDGAIRPADWHDDIHGHPTWRRHVTHVLAREIRDEIGAGPRS